MVFPVFEWILRRRPAGVTFDFVRRPVHDVHVAAIGLPAGPAGSSSKMIVAVCDPPVVFLFELIYGRVWRRIAPQPELLDKFLPLFAGRKFFECGPLAIGDKIDYILIQPFGIRRYWAGLL